MSLVTLNPRQTSDVSALNLTTDSSRALDLIPVPDGVTRTRVIDNELGRLRVQRSSSVTGGFGRMEEQHRPGNMRPRDQVESAALCGAVSGHYCFAAGTRVTCEHGLVPIEELPRLLGWEAREPRFLKQQCELPLKIKVATRGEPREALFWANSGVQPTLRVHTRRDYQVRCTQNQPFLVLGPRLRLEWKRADALEPGDLLCLPRRPRITPRGGRPFVDGFPGGPAAAQLAGILSGDVEECADGVLLHFNTPSAAEQVAMLANSVLGPDLRIVLSRTRLRNRLFLVGEPVLRFAEGLRVDGELPQGRWIPEMVFRASADEAAQFCLGLAQATSGCFRRGRVRYLEFVLGTLQAAQDLKLILLQTLGVVSGRILECDSGGYLLRVGGTDPVARFFAAARLIAQQLIALHATGVPIAVGGAYASPARSLLNPKWSESGIEAAQNDYFFEPVRRVEPDEPTWVYDLSVAGTSAFVANGFLVG